MLRDSEEADFQAYSRGSGTLTDRAKEDWPTTPQGKSDETPVGRTLKEQGGRTKPCGMLGKKQT